KEKIILHLKKFLNDDVLGLEVVDTSETPSQTVPKPPRARKDSDREAAETPETPKSVIRKVDPKDSDRVFVDVAAWNSKYYYVQGEVASPGRLPITGNETVLDAINFANGLTPRGSAANIKLVRPAPAGECCEQTLTVDFNAILNGNPTTNYQLKA